jgi:CheY-like chemotaxis protein
MAEAAVRVLVLDDNRLDAELEITSLRSGGVIVDAATAVDEADLRALPKEFLPDVILCDYSMPMLNGIDAQRILRELYGDVPLIFVTGTLSEPLAVRALEYGAVDYVLKSNLVRLAPAVERAVAEARERKRLKTSLREFEESVISHAARLEELLHVSNNVSYRGAEAISAMMARAVHAIRPTQQFDGYLGRIEGSDVVIVAAEAARGQATDGRTILTVGLRTPVDRTIFPRAGRNQSWHDLAEHIEMRDRIEKLGWRSAITTQFQALGSRYSLTFASSEPTRPFDPPDTAYLDMIAMSIASHLELNEMELSLRDQEARSSEHARRLEELWRVVNAQYQDDATLWLSMLRTAAAAIWPSIGSQARLWRIAGTDLVLESLVETTDSGLSKLLPADGTIPLNASIVAMIVESGGGTQTWDDSRPCREPIGF